MDKKVMLHMDMKTEESQVNVMKEKVCRESERDN